jgi:hypothetical protein
MDAKMDADAKMQHWRHSAVGDIGAGDMGAGDIGADIVKATLGRATLGRATLGRATKCPCTVYSDEQLRHL